MAEPAPTTLMVAGFDSAPLPDDVGVTLEDEGQRRAVVAAFRQSVNEPASTTSPRCP